MTTRSGGRKELLRNVSVSTLITHLPDIRFLTGFTGSNAVLIVSTGPRASARLFTDGRYTAQARQEVQGASVRIAPKSALHEACAYIVKSGASQCGFDPLHTTVSTLVSMRKAAREAGAAAGFFKAVESPIAKIRMVKASDEVDRMRRTAALTCALYEGMLSWVETGMRELDVAAELEYRARHAGAECMSFETIVAAGERSAQPHARATGAQIRPGDLLTLDFGIMLEGYCSDMTRTVAFGFGG